MASIAKQVINRSQAVWAERRIPHDRQAKERQLIWWLRPLRDRQGRGENPCIRWSVTRHECPDSTKFELQRQLNPRIKKPVGHIALSFKPDDKPRLTDDFMAKIALEYMQMMGINDTQFIIVRHHNTDNPHCHIVYNRINNENKLLSDRNDYRRNEQVTKALKSKYGLTYGTDKSNTNTFYRFDLTD